MAFTLIGNLGPPPFYNGGDSNGYNVFSNNGPIAFGTDLYTVTCIEFGSGSVSSGFLKMFKSTDGGATWNEQDAAHHPAQIIPSSASSGWGVPPCSFFLSDVNIIVIYGIVTGGGSLPTDSWQIAVQAYNLTTDTWGPVLMTGAPAVAPTTSFFIVPRPDASIVFFFNAYASGTTTGPPSVCIYSGGAWGSVITVTTDTPLPDEDSGIIYALAGLNGRTHLFYYFPDSSPTANRIVAQRTLLPDDSLGTEQYIIAESDTFPAVGTATAYGCALQVQLAFPFARNVSGTPNMALIRALSADNPVWGAIEDITDATHQPQTGDFVQVASAFSDSGSLFVVWWAQDNFLYLQMDDGTGWLGPGNDVQVADATAFNAGNTAGYAEALSSTTGSVVLSAADTTNGAGTYFATYALPAHTGPGGCGGGPPPPTSVPGYAF